MRHLTLLALTLTLTACGVGVNSYYTQSAQSWRGGNITELQSAWGEPFETVTTKNGNKLYVYKREAAAVTPTNYSPQIGIASTERPVPVITSMPNANSSLGSGQAGYCLISFTANSRGVIISTAIQGTNCQISSSSAEQLVKPKGKKS